MAFFIFEDLAFLNFFGHGNPDISRYFLKNGKGVMTKHLMSILADIIHPSIQL